MAIGILNYRFRVEPILAGKLLAQLDVQSADEEREEFLATERKFRNLDNPFDSLRLSYDAAQLSTTERRLRTALIYGDQLQSGEPPSLDPRVSGRRTQQARLAAAYNLIHLPGSLESDQTLEAQRPKELSRAIKINRKSGDESLKEITRLLENAHRPQDAHGATLDLLRSPEMITMVALGLLSDDANEKRMAESIAETLGYTAEELTAANKRAHQTIESWKTPSSPKQAIQAFAEWCRRDPSP